MRRLLSQNLVEGSTWYLIDVSWMKKWKKYTGYDKWDQSGKWKSENFPGLVVTSSLFVDLDTGVLKEHLMEELDYSLVPEKAWRHLVWRYGLSDGSRPIARRVVKYGLYMKHCKVEVYLLNIKLTLHPKLSEATTVELSRADTVGDLGAVMRRIYSVSDKTPCRVWHRNMSHPYELLSDPFQTLQDAVLYNMQTIVVEVQDSDGTWPRATQRAGYGSGSQSMENTTKQVKAPRKEKGSNSKQRTSAKAKKDGKVAETNPVARPRDLKTNTGDKLAIKETTGDEISPEEDDWLKSQQKSQHDELVQSVATEHKRANQASQRAQDALNRLAQKEGQLKTLNKTLEEGTLQIKELDKMLRDQEQKREGEKRRAVMAEQRVAQLQTQLQQLNQSLQTAEEERDEAQQQHQSTTHQLQASRQQLQDTEQRLQQANERAEQQQERADVAETQLQQANERADQQEQRAAIAETQLQQANERADQQEQRAAMAETRLQHSDQMFQDMFHRLIGQLPQSQPQWVVQRNEIELTGEELGSGGWATVRIGTFRGNRVAAKCLHRQIVSAHNVRIFTREMNMAANARHPNLLQFIGATLDSQEPIILTELMPTSLRRVMEEGTRLSHPQISSISRQVALALNYLHLTQPEAIIHRDVSSSNVLLEPFNSGFKAKLSDYGSANFVRHTTTVGPGNPTYAAPEAGNPEQQSTKMDVFSFGVLLVEMCAGELAPREVRDRLLASIQWPPMVALIRSCLRHKLQQRPDMATIITQLDQL
ncbi:Ubiquitin carboxyl-terminal hydrolase 4 [Geodia barretti]|uniref:Ubiquitin carboxyl-terminal hydrolase 4 n=1 Tax=Geodia barretti TaxID=519541 RepID=A0AA35X9Q4_GEOBA|nr:Ubiquitin carboxyl-terminal hydrolase 4 [Geodia barretti]